LGAEPTVTDTATDELEGTSVASATSNRRGPRYPVGSLAAPVYEADVSVRLW
jgi:hypothetical protein